LNKKLNLSNK